MNTLTARGYMIVQLADRIEELHGLEKKLGYTLPPGIISEQFRLPPVGNVPESVFEKTQWECVKLEKKIRDDYRKKHTGCCFRDEKQKERPYWKSEIGCEPNADMAVQHETDKKILYLGFQFSRTSDAHGNAEKFIRVRND